MKQPQLLVIGSSNIDHCIQLERFPRPGETLRGNAYFQAYGGKGANQAVAAAKLGANIAFATTLGADSAGQNMKTYLQEQGINAAHIACITGMATGMAMIMIDAHGENQIVLHQGANLALDATFVRTQLDDAIQHSDAVLVQLETPIDGIIAIAKSAKQHGRRLFLNPAPYCALPDDLLQHIDTITPNESEAAALTGITVNDEASCRAASRKLHDKGVRNVIITLGAKGVYLSTQDTQQHYSPFHVHAVDTTAAGDTFNGAYFSAILRGAPCDSAIRTAQAAAALSVQKHGAQPSMPNHEAVSAFLAQNDS